MSLSFHMCFCVVDVQNWSQHVNLQKAVLPDLWSFLSGGGHGVAKKVYPLLQPLVAALGKVSLY